jgi:hypothetical protein
MQVQVVKGEEDLRGNVFPANRTAHTAPLQPAISSLSRCDIASFFHIDVIDGRQLFTVRTFSGEMGALTETTDERTTNGSFGRFGLLSGFGLKISFFVPIRRLRLQRANLPW